MSKLRDSDLLIKNVKILFNTWFGFNLGEKVRELRKFTQEQESMLRAYLSHKEYTKITNYYNALQNFYDEWLSPKNILECGNPIEYFRDFAVMAPRYLDDVISKAPEFEKVWFKERITHPDHKTAALDKWLEKYQAKLDDIGVKEVKIEDSIEEEELDYEF